MREAEGNLNDWLPIRPNSVCARHITEDGEHSRWWFQRNLERELDDWTVVTMHRGPRSELEPHCAHASRSTPTPPFMNFTTSTR